MIFLINDFSMFKLNLYWYKKKTKEQFQYVYV